MYFGLAEWRESLFIIRYLDGNDVFLDIGANHGHYSILASGISRCRSYAIEPIPMTYQQLNRNINLNSLEKYIVTYPIGLSNESGTLTFSNDLGTMNKIVFDIGPDTISVNVSTLDLLGITPTVIKIDVEGFEYDVFKGGKSVLSDNKLQVIICEINFTLRKGIESKDILDYLKSFGFMPYKFNGFSLIPISEANLDTFNTIFIRDIEFVEGRILNSDRKFYAWGQPF